MPAINVSKRKHSSVSICAQQITFGLQDWL
jgi:hypothetical protein